MFSWFSKGNSEPTSQVTTTKKPTVKLPLRTPVKPSVKPPARKAASWELDALGDWKPINPPAAPGISTKAKKATPAISGSKKGLQDDVPPVDQGQDDTQPEPDKIDFPTGNDQPSDDKSLDELGRFQRQLTVKVFILEKILEDLEQKKIDLKGNITGDAAKYDVTRECPNAKLKNLSTRIFHAVKECVEPAEEEIEDLLAEIRPHLDELSAHVSALCDALDEPVGKVDAGHHKTDEEKRKAGIEICNNCIELGTELKDFLAHVLAELDLCLQSEKIGEIALNLVVQFAIFLATSRTLGFNLTFAQPYRNSLNQRIEKEKLDIEIFETDAAGTLKKAINSLNQLQLELQPQQTKVSGSGMFAAKKDGGQSDTAALSMQPALKMAK